jgi:hypothetical protein
VPFVAGVSGSAAQYLLIAGGGKEKFGRKIKNVLSDKELLTIVSMLELAGFHSLYELMMPINHYYASTRMPDCDNATYRGKVRPPFDSGDLLQDGFAKELRCLDERCCGALGETPMSVEQLLTVNPFVNAEQLLAADSPYMRFHTELEEWVKEAFSSVEKQASALANLRR